MSTFNFSQMTPAGAYFGAMNAARESDRRNVEHHVATGAGRKAAPSLRTLVRRIIALSRTTHRPTVFMQTSN